MITKNSENKLTNKQKESIIEVYTKVNNVSMLALNSALSNYRNSLTDEDNIIDLKFNIELFLYDLDSIYDLMQDNVELLWEIKDKG